MDPSETSKLVVVHALKSDTDPIDSERAQGSKALLICRGGIALAGDLAFVADLARSTNRFDNTRKNLDRQ